MMGALAWSAVGLLTVFAARGVIHRFHLSGGMPPLSAGWIGGVLGGFLADMSLIGDSVLHFRGPTVLGAVLGAAVLITITYLVGWTTASRDPA